MARTNGHFGFYCNETFISTEIFEGFARCTQSATPITRIPPCSALTGVIPELGFARRLLLPAHCEEPLKFR